MGTLLVFLVIVLLILVAYYLSRYLFKRAVRQVIWRFRAKGAINPKSERGLTRVAHRLIRKEPDDRYQTAEEVFEALTE